jgi:AAA+ ATPase superfamily predicted ATPase
MYFDEEPKTTRKDLYNFEEEYRRLLNLLEGGRRFVVVKGLRRTGKTSLCLTCFHEARIPYFFVDCRKFAQMPVITRVDLTKLLEEATNDFLRRESGLAGRALEWLKGVRGVNISLKPPSVTLSWGPRRAEALDPVSLFESLSNLASERGKRFVLVLDEAQELKRLVDYDLTRILAYTFDHLRGLQVVVTGSQVGFLYDFLRVDDPDSPMYGRLICEVSLPHLSNEQALEFLRLGFSQVKIRVPKELLEEAARRLDGVIGWLTYLGARARERGHLDSAVLEEAVRGGSRLAAKEFENFLKVHRAEERYRLLARRASQAGGATWSELKRALEASEGKRISNRRVSELIGNLVKGGFLLKENGKYRIADPLLAVALS